MDFSLMNVPGNYYPGMKNLCPRQRNPWLLKTIICTTFLAFMLIASNSFGQSITLSVKGKPASQVFKLIEKQSGYKFICYKEDLKKIGLLDVEVKNGNIRQVLDVCLKGKPFDYVIDENNVIIRAAKQQAELPAPAKEAPPQQPVQGRVVDDSTGLGIEGINIQVKGGTTGTSTGAAGSFKLGAGIGQTLVISGVGYERREIAISSLSPLTIVLKTVRAELDDVVVVGFGTQKKLSVTGSVVSASVGAVQTVSTPSLSNALVGSMSGIITRQTSGEPGNDASQIFIRGMGTWVNRNPLTLVDGVERDMNLVNVQEIESITMLKDASATAVYGVRGANGVILITTKRGKEGKPQVVFRTENAMLTALRLPNYIDGHEYASLVNEALDYAGSQPRYTENELKKFETGSDPYFYPNVNWVDMVLKKNTYQTINNLSVSGGSKFIKYYTNIGYTKQMGIYKEDPSVPYKTNATITRYNFRSNVDINVSKNFDINLSVGGIVQHNYYPGVSAARIFYAMKIIPPTQYSPVNPDGSIAGGTVYLSDNPWGLVTRSGYSRHDKNSIQGTFTGKWNLSELVTKGLSVKGTFSYDHYANVFNDRYKEFETKKYLGKNADSEDQYTLFREEKPMAYNVTQAINRSVYTEVAINYDRKFNAHSVSGLLLFNRREYVNLGTTDPRYNLPYKRQGLAGRYTYGYDNRYLLELNFGYNGSENFPPGKQYGFFPSVSAGWIVSNEKFWNGFAGINHLKLRASHGQVGNDEIGGARFMFESLFNAGGQGALFGESQTYYSSINEYQIGNKEVTWEVASKSNIGLDINLFKNKLQIQVDGFYESRKGILLKREGTTPEFSGINGGVIPYANLGRVKNRGVDGMIDFKDKSGDFFYSIRGTFTFARNTILYNDEPRPRYPYLAGVGKRIDQPFGLVALGYFQDQGDIDKSPRQTFMSVVRVGDVKYMDINKDGLIDDDDRIAIGHPRTPEWVGGLGGSVGYKNVELSLFFNAVTSTSIFIEGESMYAFSRGLGTYNILKEYYDNRWTPDNRNAKYPVVSTMENPNNNRRSTLYLRDASYLRLKSAEIAYRLPKNTLKKYKIDDVRIFINGMNLYTIDNIKIINPESNYGTGDYPLQRSINAGFQILL